MRPNLSDSDSSTISNDSVAWQKPMDLIELLGVMGSPFDEGIQHRPQAFAERGEQVFDPLTIAGARLPAHHSMFLKHSQLPDQYLLRDADNAFFQLACALRAIHQHIENDRLPASRKDG
jgi:hypothetical protein